MSAAGKDELLEAARSEFEAKGYKATSVAAIARRAGMAVGTVYLRYPSKYELFREVYAAVNREQKTRLRNSIDWSDPKRALVAWLEGNIEALASDPILAAWRDGALGPRLRAEVASPEIDFLSRQFETWRAEGRVAAELSGETVAGLISAFDVLDRSAEVEPPTISFLLRAVMDCLLPE